MYPGIEIKEFYNISYRETKIVLDLSNFWKVTGTFQRLVVKRTISVAS